MNIQIDSPNKRFRYLVNHTYSWKENAKLKKKKN